MVPFIQLSSALSDLNRTKVELLEVKRQMEETMSRVSELEGSLESATARGEKLYTALKDIGLLVGVGGPIGGLVTMMISDEDLIKDTRQKIGEIKRVR